MKTKLRKMIDLSHELYTDMPQFHLTRPLAYMETRRHNTYSHSIGTTLCIFVDHIGTHIDAPLHFNPQGKSIDSMPLEYMHQTGIVLDFAHKEPGTSISLEEVKAKFNELRLNPKSGYAVLFHTGASKKWGTPAYFEHVLEINHNAVKWLLNHGIKVYGVDAISVDTDYIHYPTHSLLIETEHYIIENLTNLDKIDVNTFELITYPIKLRGATAAPVRAVAIIYE